MKTYQPPSQLSQLHESFIDKAHRPMDLGKLPVTPREPTPIIVASDKWQHRRDPDCLVKTYRFRRPEDRKYFVSELMEYEDQVQHHAEITLSEGQVTIKLVTKTVDAVTERDKEYSLYADSVFKDIVYSPSLSPAT